MSDSWQRRVEFSRSGAHAYRPRQLLIRTDPQPPDGTGPPVGEKDRNERRTRIFDGAMKILKENFRGRGLDRPGQGPMGRHELIDLPGNPEVAAGLLRAEGYRAQPNHVVFSSSPWANPFSGNPFSGNPFSGNPFSGNPFSGNPFLDAQSRPAVYRGPGFLQGRDFSVNGQGRNLARPADALRNSGPRPHSGGTPKIAVLDVTLPPAAEAGQPGLLPYLIAHCGREPYPGGVFQGYADRLTGQYPGLVPGEDPALQPGVGPDGFLDRVAGHGMFVAGRIAQIEPDCDITVYGVLTNLGDGDEHTIAGILESLVDEQGRASVDIVNLSFGGYAVDDMNALAHAVARLQTATSYEAAHREVRAGQRRVESDGVVVVTAAGNDATDVAPYPAALPGVISVGALGPDGPAPFTNYGPWVRACASGVDVTSTFFNGFNGRRVADPEGDPDDFQGAATWSGTSFAAPLVAGRIAQVMRDQNLLPGKAAQQVLDAPGLARFPGLGTIVT